MSVVIVCSNQRAGFAQYNLYTMDIDRRNRNYYNCGVFRYLAKNYRNRGIENKVRKGRRLMIEEENR